MLSKRTKRKMVKVGLIALAVWVFGPMAWGLVKPVLTGLFWMGAPVVTALYVFPATRPMVVRAGMRVVRRVLRLGSRGVRAVVC